MGVVWWALGAVALVAAIMFFGVVLVLAWATRGGSSWDFESDSLPLEPTSPTGLSHPADVSVELPAGSTPVPALPSASTQN